MAGITTSGTMIRIEDNSNGDAGGDGGYSFADIATKLPAIFHDLSPGAAHRQYFSDYGLQNGDGVGTAPTTLIDTDCTVEFAPGKSYSVSTVGTANRRTELGILVQGSSGNPTGIKGVNLIQQGTSTIRGQIAVYGSRFIMESGVLSFAPNVAGAFAEIVNSLIDSNSSVTLGAAGANSLRRIYNVDVGCNGLGSRLSNMVADSVRRVVVGVVGSPNSLSTNAQFQARDLVFAGTPTTGDIHYTGTGEVDLLEPIWSGNAPQADLINAYLNEWWTYASFVFNPVTAAMVEGVPVQVLDKFGTILIDATTDALGQVSFGIGLFENMVKARRLLSIAGVVVDESLGPFTTRLNQTGTPHPDYLGYSYRWNWPYSNLPNGYGRQLRPMADALPLVPKYGGGAGREEFRGGFA